MKIVRFLGGLGNQMFQYAFYKALAHRHHLVKADLTAFADYKLHNGFELENVFNIKLDKASPFFLRLYDRHDRNWIFRKLRRITNSKKSYFEEQHLFVYDEKVLTDTGNKLYVGYWQNEKYFSDIAAQLKESFKFKQPLNAKNQELLNLVINSNSVAIHVRRGDYLYDPLLGNLCGLAYYLKAIHYINQEIAEPRFFVFSDDIAWCRSKLNLPDSCFISWNKGNSSFIDMQLMSNCKHHIIANSSFSWWAAWLGEHREQIVLSPRSWTNDTTYKNGIIPDRWIKI